MKLHFEIVGRLTNVEVIAVGSVIREIRRLRKVHGKGRWRKLKGISTVRLSDGTIHTEQSYIGTRPRASARRK